MIIVPRVSRYHLYFITIFLFISILSFSFAGTQSTTYTISGYCLNTVNQIGYLDTPGVASKIVVKGNLAFITDQTTGLRIIDISTPSNPYEIGHADTFYNNRAYGIKLSGNYAYIAEYSNYSSGLEIINISNPSSPDTAGFIRTPDYAYGVDVKDNYAYIVASYSGLRVIDISNPAHPLEVGSLDSSYYFYRIAVNENYAYVLGDFYGVEIIDINNPSKPQDLGNFHQNTQYSYSIAIHGNYMYIGNYSGLEIYNISNPINPIIVSQISTKYTPSDIVIKGEYAFLTEYDKGLEIVNIANPSQPYLVGYFDTPGNAYGVSADNSYIYIADGSSGLEICEQIPTPFKDVILNLSGNTILSTTPYSTGYYEFNNLPYGNYTVTPFKDNFVFSPDYRVISKMTSDQYGQNFYAKGPGYHITILTSPPGLTYNGYTTPYTYSVLSGYCTTVNATNTFAIDSFTQYGFTIWSDGGSRSHQICPYSNMTLTANYEIQHIEYVTILTSPPGLTYNYYKTPYVFSNVSGTCTTVNATSYFTIDSVTRYGFTSWSDGGSQNHQACTYSNMTLTAYYDPQYLLKTYLNPTSAGYIFSYGLSGYIPKYSIVTLYAYPYSSLTSFDHWSGDFNGTSDFTTFTMDGPKSITANFSINTTPPYSLSGYCYEWDTAGLFPLVGSYYDGQILNRIVKSGNYMYGVGYNSSTNPTGKLKIFNIKDPTKPSLMTTLNLPNYRVYSLALKENNLYVADYDQLLIYDISTPSTPYLIQSYPYDYTSINAISIKGNFIYMVGNSGLEILDISDLDNLQKVGFCQINDYKLGIDVQGNYAYVASYTYGTYNLNTVGMHIFDISDPSNPTLVGNFVTIAPVYDVKVSGNYAYLANNFLGMRILDISDPTSPFEVGHDSNSINSGSSFISLYGDYVFSGEGGNGSRVINIRHPQAPVETKRIKSSNDQSQGSVIDDQYLYFANRGLKIYKLPDTLSDITVSLSGDVNLNISTDSIGYYEFANLSSGNYLVQALNDTVNFVPVYNYSGLSTSNYIQDFYSGLSSAIIFQSKPSQRYVKINNVAHLTPYIVYSIPSSCLDISVDTIQSLGSGIGNVFNSWSDGGGMSHTICPTSNTTYTVNLDTVYYLTEQASPGYAGSVTPGNGWFDLGSSANCQTNANYGYQFIGWSGDLNGLTNPQTLSMDSAKSVTANFSLIPGFIVAQEKFDQTSDFSNWGFESLTDLPSQSSYSWESSYSESTGLLKLSFSDITMGIKITDKFRFWIDSNTPWYTLRIKYLINSDSTHNKFSILPVILTYQDTSSIQVQEIGAIYKGQTPLNTWINLDIPIYAFSNYGQVQLIVKNNGSQGDVYIDSLEVVHDPPGAWTTNPMLVNITGGSFQSSTDFNYWSFENPPGEVTPNGLPSKTWGSGVAGQYGVLTYTFDKTFEGVKQTSLDTYSVPTNQSVLMSFKIRKQYSNSTGVHVLGFLYSENTVNPTVNDIGVYGNLGNFAGYNWYTVYVPLTSSYDKDRLQIIIKNTYHEQMITYLDDIQLFYNPDENTINKLDKNYSLELLE